ncbi:hypothetical protein RND81_02G036800 [Saponaria officinalis]
MASLHGIEQLPEDGLREIMIRVASQPQGASDLARTFAVSTMFRNFFEDSDVLRSVSFEDLFPRLDGKYELFSEVGGLVARCARAGNLNARVILAKAVMVSASKLCKARTAAHSDMSLEDRYSTLPAEHYNIDDLDKASRFLDHFSAQNTDPKELIDLVRDFLSLATVRDVVEMRHHLIDFIALYHVPGKKQQLEIFLVTLDRLCEKNAFPLELTSDPRTFLAEKFNELCKTGYNMMKNVGLDEEQFRPLLENLVQISEDVEFETVLMRLDVVEPIFKQGGLVAAAQGNNEVLLVNRGVLCIAAMLRGYLMLVIDHDVFIQKARELLSSSYSAVYSL